MASTHHHHRRKSQYKATQLRVDNDLLAKYRSAHWRATGKLEEIVPWQSKQA